MTQDKITGIYTQRPTNYLLIIITLLYTVPLLKEQQIPFNTYCKVSLSVFVRTFFIIHIKLHSEQYKFSNKNVQNASSLQSAVKCTQRLNTTVSTVRNNSPRGYVHNYLTNKYG